MGSSGVSTRDLNVKLSDGSTEGDITVLLVHVDIIVSGKILENDTKVLHRVGVLLEDLANGDDLTLALSNLVLSLHLIPEVRTSNNCVLGEHSDSVASITIIASADNPILPDLNNRKDLLFD